MPVNTYPSVRDEFETIAKIKKGFSIARLGDGEFSVMDGGSTSRQNHSEGLAREMLRIVNKPNQHCLVGIPTMNPKGSKYKTIEPSNGKPVGWHRHKERYCRFLSPKVNYYSAFISRPDCGEWMMNVEYAKLVQSMWLNRKVLVIGPADTKILLAVKLTQDAEYIECLKTQAYQQIDELERKALESDADLVLISAGMLATCLAHRLSPHKQAIDIGSIGGFLLTALVRGEVRYTKEPKVKA